MKKTILITGTNGQLGNELRAISSHFPALNILSTSRNEFDITDNAVVKKYFLENEPSALINCAAYTAVDKAESEPELAQLVNSTAVGYLADACKLIDIPFIHISTDFVYDGNKSQPHLETDATNPLGVYAKTKLHGEQIALQKHKKTIIVRTSWVYSSFGNNFVKTMLRLGSERPELKVVNDQTGSPTYARDLAEVLLKVTLLCDALKPWGIYNFSNDGAITWCEFAKEILALKGSETPVLPITTAQFPTPAMRPLYSVMSKEKIIKTFGIHPLPWKHSLEECLKLIP
ncbi:MAG: dTDP-4-dehydrorhamnose reductase [Sphingobacteriales bacterium]|nr:MAG: dTDP-4-dehydrorhamnose reductase [Sphingobacteriales bacterium]